MLDRRHQPDGGVDGGAGGISYTSATENILAITGRGLYHITLPQCTLSATIADSDGKGNDKVLSDSHLGDIPFQICIAGSIKSADTTFDESRKLQQQFLKQIDLVTQERDALRKLFTAGHQSFNRVP